MSINIQGRTGWNSIPNSIGRSKLPHPTVHLLVNLLSHAEGFNATYSVITEQTGMSSRTIASSLDNLKKLGIVSVTKVKGSHGRFDSNDYDFYPERLWKLTPEFVDERLRGKTTAVGGEVGDSDRCTRESGTAVRGKAAPLYEVKRKKEQGERPRENDHPPLTPKGADGASTAEVDPALDRFQDFYDTYGRKKKRPDAERAWKKAVKKADPHVIIDAAAHFVAAQKAIGKHPQYTPYPASWLNSESWNDEIDTAPQPIPTNSFNDPFGGWLSPTQTNAPELPPSEDLFNSNFIDHQENY